jgi:hypothetical protein
MKKTFNETTRPSRYRLVDFYTMRETISQKTMEAGGSSATENVIREYHFHTGTDPSQPKEPYAAEWKQVGDEVTPLGTKKLTDIDPDEVNGAYQALIIFGGMPDPLKDLLKASQETPPQEPGVLRRFLNSFRPGR